MRVRPLLLLLSLCAGPVSLRSQLYLGDDNRYVGGAAIDTFRGADENDPSNLGLFAPLPDPDYPDTFRFDIERFRSVISPFEAFLKTPDFEAEDESTAIYRQILGIQAKGQDWNAMLVRAEQLLENHPEEARNIRGLATLYALTGRYDRAARNFARYLEKKPSDVTFLAGFAHTLFCLARFDDAHSAIRRAMEINPSFLPAQYALSCLGIATNAPASRIRAYWQTAGIYEKEQLAGWLHNDRTPLRHVLGLKGYERLCELALGNGSTANLVLIPDSLSEARGAFARQQWRKALVYYELAEGYGVEGTAVKQQLARCLYETGKAEESVHRMRALAGQFPGHAEVWYNLGYLLINQKAPAEATKAFREAARLSPSVAEYQFALACALALNQQMDDAAAFMDPVLKKAVQDFSDALYAGELIDLLFLSLTSVHSSFYSVGRFGSARVCFG